MPPTDRSPRPARWRLAAPSEPRWARQFIVVRDWEQRRTPIFLEPAPPRRPLGNCRKLSLRTGRSVPMCRCSRTRFRATTYTAIEVLGLSAFRITSTPWRSWMPATMTPPSRLTQPALLVPTTGHRHLTHRRHTVRGHTIRATVRPRDPHTVRKGILLRSSRTLRLLRVTAWITLQ